MNHRTAVKEFDPLDYEVTKSESFSNWADTCQYLYDHPDDSYNCKHPKGTSETTIIKHSKKLRRKKKVLYKCFLWAECPRIQEFEEYFKKDYPELAEAEERAAEG